jgi:hypothetical protein
LSGAARVARVDVKRVESSKLKARAKLRLDGALEGNTLKGEVKVQYDQGWHKKQRYMEDSSVGVVES